MVATLGAALLAGRCALAATIVSPINGAVLINQGKGFVEIANDVEVSVGTKVMVRPGGSAMIYYGNNCSAEIGPGQVWVVKPDVKCSAPGAGVAGGPVTGAVTGAIDLPGYLPGYVTPGEMAFTAMGMTAATGMAIAAALNGNSDHNLTPPVPVSP